MADTTTVNAKARTEFGSGASKRIRRSGLVPAVVYGGSGKTVPVALDPKEIFRLLRSEAGRNTILDLKIEGGDTDNVILKDWQVDPVKETILHADFQRVAMDQVLKVTVPIVIRGESIGIKTEGGLLDVVVREIEVECLPADIPERFECDVSELHMHESLRVRDLPVLERVEILEDGDRVVVHVVPLRAEEEEEEAVPVEGEEVEGAPEGEEGDGQVAAKSDKEEGEGG
jgi:large subunit ribosomal protein L25